MQQWKYKARMIIVCDVMWLVKCMIDKLHVGLPQTSRAVFNVSYTDFSNLVLDVISLHLKNNI